MKAHSVYVGEWSSQLSEDADSALVELKAREIILICRTSLVQVI